MPDNTSTSNSFTQEEEISSQKFLDRPITKLAVRIISERLTEACPEPTPSVAQPTPPPTNHDVIRTILLAWLAIGFGVLAIAYPHFLDDFSLNQVRGNDFASVICTLVFIVLVKLLWNQVGGAILIALSLILIARSLFQKVAS